MKNLFKKGAVAAAVAGSLMVSGVTSADSLLAPLVVGIPNGPQTYFSLKVRGSKVNAPDNQWATKSKLHYAWFEKGSTLDDLYALGKPCSVTNNSGISSPWDMVFQRAVDDDEGSAGGTAVDNHASLLKSDKSQPAVKLVGSGAGFVGFAIITDTANEGDPTLAKDLDNEGDFSGFGYVVDAANSFVLDYKLLNNHRSKVEGDFDVGFISKKSIDYSWMPISIATTQWLTVAITKDMVDDGENGGYDATVAIGQKPTVTGGSPTAPNLNGRFGLYNNDERFLSGAVGTSVTCMGLYTRDMIVGGNNLNTVNGGWFRASILNSTTRTFNNVTSTNGDTATGAITYKAELLNFATGSNVQAEVDSGNTPVFGNGVVGQDTTTVAVGVLERTVSDNAAAFDIATPGSTTNPVGAAFNNNGVVSFQVETSGHLSANEPHPNRPF